MQDIDDRIRMSNPDAQILPIGSNPLLEGTLKEGFAKNRPLYNSDLSQMGQDDRSQAGFSNISRRSDFTTVQFGVASNGKPQKMPGEASLKAKAEERMQKAKMMELDRQIREIR